MTTPTFAQWREAGSPITDASGNVLVPAQTVQERFLMALICAATGTNPDGTPLQFGH